MKISEKLIGVIMILGTAVGSTAAWGIANERSLAYVNLARAERDKMMDARIEHDELGAAISKAQFEIAQQRKLGSAGASSPTDISNANIQLMSLINRQTKATAKSNEAGTQEQIYLLRQKWAETGKEDLKEMALLYLELRKQRVELALSLIKASDLPAQELMNQYKRAAAAMHGIVFRDELRMLNTAATQAVELVDTFKQELQVMCRELKDSVQDIVSIPSTGTETPPEITEANDLMKKSC